MNVKTGMLEDKKCIFFTVKGTSMSPTLKSEDIVLIKHISPSEIKKRDIILFKGDCKIVLKSNQEIEGKIIEKTDKYIINADYAVCHRVVKIVNEKERLRFYARGDANIGTEEVSENKIIGKVIAVYRNKAQKFLSYECSFVYCLLIIIFTLFRKALKKLIGVVLFNCIGN